MFALTPIMTFHPDGISCLYTLFGQPITGWKWNKNSPYQVHFSTIIKNHNIDGNRSDIKTEAVPVVAVDLDSSISDDLETQMELQHTQESQVKQAFSISDIVGIGPKIEEKLRACGITTIEQLAALTKEDIILLEHQLGNIQNRIERGDWIAQAKALLAQKA
ncbi:MAG: hypothetical protein ACON5C_07510 [Alphaproteobacteria bacterium]